MAVMHDFSEHPTRPITELEVVTGIIITKTGVQSRRQRDRASKLKDEFDRVSSWITDSIRQGGRDLCVACLCLPAKDGENSGLHRRSDAYSGFRSFRIVAACELLAELDILPTTN